VSLTAIVWAALFFIALFGAFFNPLFGLFGYLLEYFQRPALYWWGRELPDLRWNFTIGAATAAAYLMQSNSLPAVRRTTNVAFVLMLLQAANTSIVTLWAVTPDISWNWSVQYWKLVVTYALFAGIVRTPRTLALVILFQIIGAAWWGWDALDNRRFGARLEGLGSGDTQNANALGAHLLTIIPLTVLFAVLKQPMWIRVVAAISLPLILNLMILTNSRGVTLGLAASGLAAVVLVRKGLRKRMVLGAAMGVVGLYLIADPEFVERQQSIVSPEDNSAQSRLSLWAGSSAMIWDYPLGAGGKGFHFLSPRYVPELEAAGSEGRSSHNTYIQVAADWGIQGLILFLALIVYTFKVLHRVRKERVEPDWIYFVSLGMQLGLIGTLTAAFFSVRFFGESIYWLCGLSTALYQMTGSAAAEDESTDRVQSAAA
jgi:putative inorganic carbon (hco3(-)) transporter